MVIRMAKKVPEATVQLWEEWPKGGICKTIEEVVASEIFKTICMEVLWKHSLDNTKEEDLFKLLGDILTGNLNSTYHAPVIERMRNSILVDYMKSTITKEANQWYHTIKKTDWHPFVDDETTEIERWSPEAIMKHLLLNWKVMEKPLPQEIIEANITLDSFFNSSMILGNKLKAEKNIENLYTWNGQEPISIIKTTAEHPNQIYIFKGGNKDTLYEIDKDLIKWRIKNVAELKINKSGYIHNAYIIEMKNGEYIVINKNTRSEDIYKLWINIAQMDIIEWWKKLIKVSFSADANDDEVLIQDKDNQWSVITLSDNIPLNNLIDDERRKQRIEAKGKNPN